MNPAIFRAYDIRGVYPTDINEEVAYKTAQAYAKLFSPKTVVLGRDVRTSGPMLFVATAEGFMDHGVNVIDIGVITTDMLYFAAATLICDGGITVSASHNPREFNGMKLVRAGAVPISGDSGIKEIQELVMSGYGNKVEQKGVMRKQDITEAYLKKCLSFIDIAKIKPLKVVANGMFGPAIQNIQKLNLPIKLVLLNEIPDGTFPKGQPDPLQEQNRIETSELISREKPDFGVAWDADADRFFLFDENGRYISGYYVTAFLGEYFAKKNLGSKVINDVRLTWAVADLVRSAGGQALENKAGHAFIKERMRKEDAVFGGEMSGHYYFRDYFYADNGLIPFLLILQIVSESGRKVSELFQPLFRKYFISGEINISLPDFDSAKSILTRIEAQYPAIKKNYVDGLSLEEKEWRANIRPSNTEPLLRLNVEAKSEELMKQKTEEILNLIRNK